MGLVNDEALARFLVNWLPSTVSAITFDVMTWYICEEEYTVTVSVAAISFRRDPTP